MENEDLVEDEEWLESEEQLGEVEGAVLPALVKHADPLLVMSPLLTLPIRA